VIEFIKQEGQHSFYHILLNKQLIKQGYQQEVSKIVRLADILTPNVLFHNYKIKLACVSGGEQLIQALGLWLLSNKEGSFIDKEIERFFCWHAIEELEHYHISFEVCVDLKVNYFFRTLGLFITGFYVFLVMLYGIILFIRKDRLYIQPHVLVESLLLIFTRRYTNRILFIELVKTLVNNLNPFYSALNNNELLIKKYDSKFMF
jgi:predicted metal-dependent hydrolase